MGVDFWLGRNVVKKKVGNISILIMGNTGEAQHKFRVLFLFSVFIELASVVLYGIVPKFERKKKRNGHESNSCQALNPNGLLWS